MPCYVEKVLRCFKHEPGKNNGDQPYEHVQPNYGAEIQYAIEEDLSEPLGKEVGTWVQRVVGIFLHDRRAVDGTMICLHSAIAMDQANLTQDTLKKVRKCLDYVVTHLYAILAYHTSNMILT